MEVVDVHVKSIRPEYQNLKDWCSVETNVYIGRGQIVFIDGKRYPEKGSKWCNPFTVKKYGQSCMKMFEEHLDELLEDEDNLEEFKLLRDKTLGCWCAPKPCHGDIIMKKLQELP